MDVTLTWFECQQAAQTAVSRRIESMRGNYSNRLPWDYEIEGAAAELAFAKATKMYWDFSVNTFKRPDVGNLQIRQTNYWNGKLILRPDTDKRKGDSADELFVLICGKMPKFRIIGWLEGSEAKQDRYWNTWTHPEKGPFWEVPQDDLHSVDSLIDILEIERTA